MAVDSNPSETKVRTAVQQVYDGSGIYFQVLRACGWGTLLNLGYSQPWDWVIYPFRADIAQERLVQKSIALLQTGENQQVLDVACGKGKSSFLIAMQNPTATVIGLDKVESHVQVAELLFGCTRNLKYFAGSAESLPFADQTFDRIHCLEAAFHFDRDRFIQETYRVLKPVGRVVIVDFMWRNEASRQMLKTPEGKLVQELWQFEDFWTVEEYRQASEQAGFRVVEMIDWTAKVSAMSHKRMSNLVQSFSKGSSRLLTQKLHKPLMYFSDEDWQVIQRYTAAHEPLGRVSQYMALVLEKA